MIQGAFRATLTTQGRKTGKPHSVQLRAVGYNGMVYFSRRNENSDWLKNSLANNIVQIEFDGKTMRGTASLVTDKALAKKISELKYPGEERASEVRIVLQVRPD
jgi:deazaflavin-dependent oxidoreductase (nitroreductase family)